MNLTRTVALNRADQSGQADQDEIALAISSEAPYERWFGIEILGHKASEVDLSRLADNRHPLLLDHDTTNQVGVVRAPEIGADGVLRAVARFSKSPRAQEIKQDVRDEIKTLVSVGYMVEEMVELKRAEGEEFTEVRRLSWPEFEAEQRALHGENFYRAGPPVARAKGEEPPVYRVTRWQPFEASLVAVPADVTVGVGRSAEASKPQAKVQQEENPATPEITQPIFLKETKMSEVTQKDPAQLERDRVSSIMEAGQKHGKYVGQKDVENAIRNGHSVDQFRDLVWGKIESRHTDTSDLNLGLTRKEAQRYSFGNMVRALTLKGDDPAAMQQVGFELECSRAMAQMLGRQPEGIYVPYDIFRRDFNVGTSTEAGNLVPTDLRGDLYVDALRASMVMAGLGVRILPGLTGNVDIPRKKTPGSLAGVTEIGSASETQPVTDLLQLRPKRVSAYVEASKQAIIQSAVQLESMLRDDLVTGAAVQIENYMIQGSSASNGTGIIYRSGLGTVSEASNGTALLWDHLVDLETAAATANAEPDRLAGYLLNTAIRGKAKKTQRGTNLPFIWEMGDQALNGYRGAVTNNVPRNLTKGTSTTVASALTFSSDWSMMVLGFFGGVDVTVDPYSKSDTGQVKISLNQFWDYTIRQPDAFVVRKDILTA
jgi:HK97 family phage major capsid protein